jgi:hypothetical protein
MQHVREGTVRALAVTSKTRSQIFPDVPTMAEAGYPQIEGDSWVGILVPAGTPAEIIAVLSRESSKILEQPDMKERLAALGYDLVASTPKEFATRIAAEIEMWAKVIRAANIKPERSVASPASQRGIMKLPRRQFLHLAAGTAALASSTSPTAEFFLDAGATNLD